MLIAEVAFPLPLFKTFHYSVPESLKSKASRGFRVQAPFGSRGSLTGIILSLKEGDSPYALKEIQKISDPAPILEDDLLDLALWLSEKTCCPLGEALKAVLPGWVKPFLEAAPQEPSPLPESSSSFALTSGQQEVVSSLLQELEKGEFRPALLFGVPASGKTEVYRRLLRKALHEGGQALFLVPEISLTAPFVEELSQGLSDRVLCWHSRLAVKEKRRAWNLLTEGRPCVVVGSRSACLLPFKRLRLAVMDEEQDESFKQDSPAPYYHARDVVLERAQRHKALAVFGSATPSLEAYHLALQNQWLLCRLDQRVSAQREFPHVEAVRREKGELITPRLRELIEERLKNKEQVILLTQRRGFAPSLSCLLCGFSFLCPKCRVHLVLHQKEGKKILLCHHCGHKEEIRQECPHCKTKEAFLWKGIGTQRLVQEIEKQFPQTVVARLDKDTAQSGKSSRAVYQSFKGLNADILIGTKLVSKGFHFPQVTLSSVIDADWLLSMPDFRASEKAFQLFYQLAGRSGRGEKPGCVVIQTSKMDHEVIRSVQGGSFEAFAQRELENRQALGYPPFVHLARMVIQSKKEALTESTSKALADWMRKKEEFKGIEILGPAVGIYSKLRGFFRKHILLKSENSGILLNALKTLPGGQYKRWALLPSGVRLKVQIDPMDFS